MAIVVPRVGENELGRRIFNMTAKKGGSLYVRLFINNISLDDSIVLSSMQEVVDGSYAPIEVSADADVSIVDGIATIAQKSFNLPGNSSYAVYGYFITVSNGTTGFGATPDPNTELLWAEKFPTPFNIVSGTGGQIRITPKLELE